MIGSTISHYLILDKLGEGGMGVGYKAQDTPATAITCGPTGSTAWSTTFSTCRTKWRHKIAAALQVSLTDADEETLAKKPTDDLRAYEFYMRRAYESGYRAVAHSATTDSAFDDVRGLPEFQRLVADLG